MLFDLLKMIQEAYLDSRSLGKTFELASRNTSFADRTVDRLEKHLDCPRPLPLLPIERLARLGKAGSTPRVGCCRSSTRARDASSNQRRGVRFITRLQNVSKTGEDSGGLGRTREDSVDDRGRYR